MENQICQSCAMPLTDSESLGTGKDGSKSSEYCCYCYKDGLFTADVTMEQMIDACAGFFVENNKDADKKLTVDEVKAFMKESFPQLKRWKNG